jgi:beta-phosphoglucomutase-like phosphatase (HAD superfamily)
MNARAHAMMRARRDRLRLVIFDCDGVLIDSEPVADRVVAEELAALGWPITPSEAHSRFLGMRMEDMPPLIEDFLGRPLPTDWVLRVVEHLVVAMSREAVVVPGAMDALAATDALGLDWRIASNSGLRELAAKFLATGLTERVAGRVLSATDIAARGGRGKPAPDIFLAAAEQAGCDPLASLVIEDSPLGVQGAIAAGMQCLGLDATGDGAHLAAVGAVPIRSMHDVPTLLQAALA